MLVLLGLIFVPLMWSIPMAFMTVEMACMIPESGGHVLWVYRAFGPFWSFLNSFFAVTSSMLNNAMYPSFFALYISTFISTKPLPHALTIFLKALMLLAVTVMNVLGIDIVGMYEPTNHLLNTYFQPTQHEVGRNFLYFGGDEMI